MSEIYCLGDAVVDAIADVPEAFLEDNLLEKRKALHITQNMASQFIEKFDYDFVAGGNAANIAQIVASLGGKSRFVGTRGNDQQGAFFKAAFHENVVYETPCISELPTGTIFTFITPDRERTFASYPGAGERLDSSYILEDEILKCKIVYLDGYTLRSETAFQAMLHAARLAKKHGKMVAFSANDTSILADFSERCSSFFEISDILFFNVEEALKATLRSDLSGLMQYFESRPQTVVITNGEQGSYILPAGRPMLQVSAAELTAPIVDTNGAGDAYAAGYLFGVVQGAQPDRCAKLASLTARECLQSQGARITQDLSALLDEVF